MTDKLRSSGEDTDDRPEFKRRQVLAGIGGVAATGSLTGLTGGDGNVDNLAGKWASGLAGVSTERDRREAEYLYEELQNDAAVLAERDLEDLSAARRREFAGKGQRLRSMMAGECGYEGYEVWGGPYDGCCAAHDECEGQNDKPDSVFNGDDCDAMFWGCVATITAILA